ncbi:hypothetical protein PC9H_005432 [Pleurotus ostreatus]|uniref:Uncharacterized protein n=2 Tax=Pleurotus ostreatus TaxID=5322 RepID=A0A067NXQ1_PLEO1|nr:uncharacterized protein PC9H_005432 [Pleurotus ostreatus]KAF7433480.1 hypothetical protein PC9H_005432 [Pleurotus ostreatus]KAJ8697813.1 hypothetical protein PTI98_004585 [Pleurotus ostreatus]KDQ28927.1 hypothetical protein PLEOSDRAFT_1088932 [Pleurotus ostreatus PC15]
MGKAQGGSKGNGTGTGTTRSLDQADTDTIRELKDKLNDIRTLIANEPELAGYREFDQLSQIVEQTTRKVEDIEEFRDENPGRVIRHATFTSVNDVDMKNLGVQTDHIIPGEELGPILAEAFEAMMPPSFKTVLERLVERPKLRQYLINANSHIETLEEIGSRVLVNRWILELSDICDQLHICLFLQLDPRFCEITNPARIDYKEYTTLLTHHADYGSEHPDERLEAYKKGELRTIGIQRCYSDSSQETFMVLEALGQKIDLQKYIPQAVARCLVLIHCTEEQKSSTHASFCLTNGRRWIFAVVDSLNGVCLRTSDIIMELSKDPPAKIMKPLFYWSTIRSRIIYNKLKEFV